MIFKVVSVLVPILIYWLLPKILEQLFGKKPVKKRALLIAGLLFFIAWYLPSPDIHGQYTAFITHIVGGGIFSGFLWLYILKQLQFKLTFVQNLIATLVLVSVLGVANELFEVL